MTPIHTLILDFDGVIVESNDIKTRAFATVFSRFPAHADAMMAYHQAHVSASRFDKFRYLVTQLLGRPADDPLMDELAAAFSDETRKQVIACPLVPGAAEFLDIVSARVPVYLASVTPQADLDAILAARGLTHYFTRVYGCPPWTKATAIKDIIGGVGGVGGVSGVGGVGGVGYVGRAGFERVNTAVGTLFIGDSAGDQRAALETGVEFLARDSGLRFDDPQPPSGPDMSDLLARVVPRLPGVTS